MAADKQTRRERLEAREAAILDAARAVFSTAGYDGAKMAEIAARAAVAEGTIYLYFKNKDALLEAVINRFYAQLTEGAERGVADLTDTFSRLEFLARHHLEECLREWRLLELMTGRFRALSAYEHSTHRALNRRYTNVFDGVVREGMHRGELREDLPRRLLRDLFYGTLEYTARTLKIHADEAASVEDVVAATLDVLRFGTVAARPASSSDRGLSRLEQLTVRLEAAVDRVDGTVEQP